VTASVPVSADGPPPSKLGALESSSFGSVDPESSDGGVKPHPLSPDGVPHASARDAVSATERLLP
jgi:hypothetical protein